MRHRLSAGEESSRYRPGQWVSAEYAARYPDKVSEDRPREEGEIDYVEEPFDYDDYDWWDGTAEYGGE